MSDFQRQLDHYANLKQKYWKAVDAGDYASAGVLIRKVESYGAYLAPQLVAAVKGVLDVLDTYPAPRKEADPTGYTTARLDLLEHYIRKAIRDAMKRDDDD